MSEYKLWQLVSSSSFSVTKGLGNPLFAGAELHSQREGVGKTKGILLEAKIAKLLETVLILKDFWTHFLLFTIYPAAQVSFGKL